MSKIVNIQSINPVTFEYQTYSPQDESLISSFEITNNFNFSSSYIEYFIYDLNNTILYRLKHFNFSNYWNRTGS